MVIKKRKFIICFIVVWGIVSGCSNKKANQKSDALNKGKIAALEGKTLVKQYCSTCHLPPTADQLDKETWLNHDLPMMANNVGIGVYGKKQYFAAPKAAFAKPIPVTHWFKIIDYFKKEAPDTLIIAKQKLALQLKSSETSLFSVEKPHWNAKLHSVSATTLVRYNSFNHRLYTSNATNKNVYSWGQNLTPTFIQKLHVSGVEASFYIDSNGDNHGVFTDIGTLKQINSKKGKLVDYNFSKGTKRIIADSLPRPAYGVPGDFNNDGLRDWIVCAFGHATGGLYLFTQQLDASFKKSVIRHVSGAIHAVKDDFNHDGWLDMMVLFAQGNEGIWMFTNNKKGGFIQRNLLRFPPVYGSNSFQLVDFNKDGKPDILYTAGDNGDYSVIFKPYHGIYIFMNKGDYHYKKAYFYHINGATNAIAADFDEDGDFDIAAISYYADIKGTFSPDTFIYFKQDRPLHFIPLAPAEVHKLGRWISMDVADIDGDGDLDIALGNYSRGSGTGKNVKTPWNTRLPFIVLRNKTTD